MPPRLPLRAFSTIPFQPTCSPVPHYSTATASSSRVKITDGAGLVRPTMGGARSFHSSSPSDAAAKDPYKVIGVSKDASASDIKKTYYQLAKKYHPDTNKDKAAQAKFLEIQAAYDILSDQSKRSAYDQYGSQSQEPGFDPSRGGGGSPFGAGGFGGFQGFGGRGGQESDLFESLFGGAFSGGARGGSRQQQRTRGEDIETVVTISFMESCSGTTKKINIQPIVGCTPCGASGLKKGASRSTCGVCRGTGQQTFSLQGMMMASTCQACGGAGSSVPREGRCASCDGVGKVRVNKAIDVPLPAGIDDGMKFRVAGEGDMPISGAGVPGDVLVRVNVTPSTQFRRQGTNLYHTSTVPIHIAMLGGKMRIPTLEGDVEIKVSGGTRDGEESVLKLRGVKSVYGKERGDLVVVWKLNVPRSLTARQREILQAYANDVEGHPTYFSTTPPAPKPQDTVDVDAASEEVVGTQEEIKSETEGKVAAEAEVEKKVQEEAEEPKKTASSSG